MTATPNETDMAPRSRHQGHDAGRNRRTHVVTIAGSTYTRRMSSTRAFDPEVLARFDEAKEVVIETVRPTGERRRTVIWIMTDGVDAYVRSVRGVRGRWFRDVIARPDAMITVGGERIPVDVLPASDRATIDPVSDLIRAKYGRSSSADTASMLRSETLETTLRLEPA